LGVVVVPVDAKDGKADVVVLVFVVNGREAVWSDEGIRADNRKRTRRPGREARITPAG